MRRAVALRPDDVRPYLELNEVVPHAHASPDSPRRARCGAPQRATPRPHRGGEIDACVDLGDWERGPGTLRTHTFHLWEGEFGMRAVWVNVNLGRGGRREFRRR